MNLPSRQLRWCLSILTVGLIYMNCAVVSQHVGTRWQTPALPIPNKVAGVFRLFGMFSSYETNNSEMVLWGYATDARDGTNGWKLLPTREYFPYKRGVQRQLLWSAKFFRSNEPDSLARAWVRSGAQILARHNRLHPDAPISQLAFETRTWPRSPAGYYALQNPESLQTNFWIVVTNR